MAVTRLISPLCRFAGVREAPSATDTGDGDGDAGAGPPAHRHYEVEADGRDAVRCATIAEAAAKLVELRGPARSVWLVTPETRRPLAGVELEAVDRHARALRLLALCGDIDAAGDELPAPGR